MSTLRDTWTEERYWQGLFRLGARLAEKEFQRQPEDKEAFLRFERLLEMQEEATETIKAALTGEREIRQQEEELAAKDYLKRQAKSQREEGFGAYVKAFIRKHGYYPTSWDDPAFMEFRNELYRRQQKNLQEGRKAAKINRRRAGR